MDAKRLYRLRVENCIGTIIEVQKKVRRPCGDEKFLSRFEDLKKAISLMDMSSVSESDVLMVEQATNALLGEFRPVFESESSVPLYEKARH